MSGSLIIEDAQLVFRNFAGKEGKYNAEGDRNFCVLLDEGAAEDMLRDGWNIKALRSREEGDPDRPYVQVSVGFKFRPPKLVMVTSKGRTDLTEEELELFDFVDIKKVDLIIRPYTWAVGGKSGIKAYLKSMFLTVEEDYLDLKYADVPEIGAAPSRLELEAGPEQDPRVLEGEWH
jgi:hypothetical protein